jgi:hypothetical protein
MLGLWTDSRIGGHPELVHCDSDELMQLPQEVKKLVCFVHVAGGGREDLGTGFFVFDPLDINNAKGVPQAMIYMVTARHVVQRDPDEEPPVDSIRLRLNTLDGGSSTVKTTVSGWKHHDTADVSVYSFGVGAAGLEGFDFLYAPIRPWPGPYYRSTSGQHRKPAPLLCAGTDVFMTGLLVHHPGVTRIMPIIRVGNIAEIPEDPVHMDTGADHIILMESRSISGLSGSPVFAHYPPSGYDERWRVEHMASPRVANNAGPNYLIGINRGPFESEGNDIDGIGDASTEPLNTGISIIVPIERARELIDGPELAQERDEARKALLAAGEPAKHSAQARRPTGNA